MILFLFMVCFLMICSTGCSNYDYDRDAPIGITVQEFETNIDQLLQWVVVHPEICSV